MATPITDLSKEEFNTLRTELQQIRGMSNSYFEKLALLDGGAVGLVVTVVLGQLHGHLRHRYTLGAGLTLLVLAMACLMIRNYRAVQMELIATVNSSSLLHDGKIQGKPMRLVDPRSVNRWASAGSWLTLAGMAVLLAEVWLILR